MRLYFWLGLAVLGFLLYLAPSFMVNHMYESFATHDAVPTPTLPAPTPAPLIQNAMAELERVANTPVLASPTAPAPVVEVKGAKQAPVEYATVRSTPGNPRDLPVPSVALQQGAAFCTSLPRVPTPAPEVHREIIVVQAPAPRCPNCPDMRDYIRKDSIPCWGCSLRR
jgi:hypothetical protein